MYRFSAGDYLVFYRINPDGIELGRMVHGARSLRSTLRGRGLKFVKLLQKGVFPDGARSYRSGTKILKIFLSFTAKMC